jgi:hypothetical protein|tara:strand:+ start:1624 stop:1902 length:279 start_codon:yes stop_codon:yes gene_type:complete
MVKLNIIYLKVLWLAKIESNFERQISAIRQGSNPRKELKLRTKFSRLYEKTKADYTDENGNKVDKNWIMEQPINDVLDFIKLFFKDIVGDIE